MPIDDANAPPPGVDGVELKVTLGVEQVDAGLAVLRLAKDGDTVERRQIWFCEQLGGHRKPDTLPLLARGIIVRVRKRADHADDATLKLRGPEGSLDPRLWHERTAELGKLARIEGDWVADRHLVSASLDAEVEGGLVDEVEAHRPHQVRRLLSGDQRALADDLLLGLDGLTLLGPIRAWKWDKGTGELPDQVAAELWEVDEQLRFLELSAREEEDPLGGQRQLDETLRAHDLQVDPDQQTKTSAVLAHLAAAEAARG
ncbi:MAG TPA: hypothetical protein VF486_21670 [Actinomycetes bacterium]